MSFDNPDDDFEILDVENYRGKTGGGFSREGLVMKALSNVIENGNHELREGYTNERQDMRGNVIKTYIEDTRLKFIESVDTAIDVMECEYDENARKNIKKLKDDLEELKIKMLKEQWDWYNGLAPKDKQLYIKKVIPNYFNRDLPFYYEYMLMKIKIYRKIASELHSLTSRLDFYQEGEIVG